MMGGHMADHESPGAARASGVRWNLTDLYLDPRDPRIDEDLQAARLAAEDFATRYRGRVGSGALSPEELAEALCRYEKILEQGQRPRFYASLLFSADTQDETAQALEERAEEAWTEIHGLLLFFELEVQELPEEALRRALDHEAISPYRHFLTAARRYRPHTLSEPEEKILDRKHLTSRSSYLQLYDELSGSLRFEIEVDGERKLLTDGEVMALLHRPERDLRRCALEAFLSKYKTQELVFTSIFNALLLDHRLDADLRRFPSLIAPRHLENEIEAATVEAMLDATDRHAPDIREYLLLKARLLDLPDMTVADVYAPFSTEAESIPFDEARGLVIESFAGFSETFAALARPFFASGWIDAEVRPGKRHGAFCAAHSPRHHPYVLASYAGTSNDVSTIAHELGHGIHALLARRQSLLEYDAPLVLSEIASIFAEMLLTEQLFRRASSPRERARILCNTLDDIYATIFRQAALTRFELAAHEARRRQRLSAPELGALWLETQKSLFGGAVAVPEIYQAGWSAVPHFVHSPFYCYSYSFGNLLVLSLFERYREEGPAFVPRYLGLLESGGSDTPARLLGRLGADISAADFWENGFRAVTRLIEDLRRESTTIRPDLPG